MLDDDMKQKKKKKYLIALQNLTLRSKTYLKKKKYIIFLLLANF